MDDISLVLKYFPGLSDLQKQQFSKLYELYNFWNPKINVISRKDIASLYEHHVLHSLAIAKFIRFNPGTKVLDVGTGGGFPGIPLAIMFPGTQFLLADSIGKKIKVVSEVSAALGLVNVRAAHARAEELKENFDFAVSRAVVELDRLYSWVKNKLNKKSFNEIQNGIICLKGGNLSGEIKNFGSKVKVVELKEYFGEFFFETKKLVYLPV